MKNILQIILDSLLQVFENKKNKTSEIKKREEDLNRKIDRATNYSIELDKSIINLLILIFIAGIFGIEHFKIQITSSIHCLFICWFLTLLFIFLSMFFAKWQKQKNIDIQNKYICWCNDINKVTQKEYNDDEKEQNIIMELGKYIEIFSALSYIGFLITGFFFMHIFLLNINSIK